MSNERIDLTQFEGITEGYADGAWELNNPQDTHCLVPLVGTIAAFSEANANAVVQLPKLIAELKRCYEVMNEVILRAMDAREEEVSDIIKHGDEEYVHVDEITYPFSKSDIDAAFDSKASE